MLIRSLSCQLTDVFRKAYDRMKTRRSKLASQILTHVKTLFDGAEFRNRPERIREYVLWALRTGGPAYYETPVPISCKLRKDDPSYPVSFFSHRRFMLTIYSRNQVVFYAPNSSSRLPRHTLALQRSRFSIHLWDQRTHLRACMPSF